MNMETLATMPTIVRHIPGAKFSPELQKEFNVKPHQLLRVTVEVEDHDDEYDMGNLGNALIESAKEIAEAKKHGRELPNARDLINSL